MDEQAKKTALRMIPYGLYVLTGRAPDGRSAAAAVNWVTQASFEPPLVVVGIKADSRVHEVVRTAGSFALNVLGKGQQDVAYAFFKAAEEQDGTIGGQPFRAGATGAPLLECAAAHVECTIVDAVERGDHTVVVGQVTGAAVANPPEGRPDAATLRLEDLGDKIFYGG